MTHAMVVDNDKNSPTSGMEVFTPVTVLEVPPIVIMGIRSYEKTNHGLKAITEVIADNLDEELSRKITLPKDNDQSEAIAKLVFLKRNLKSSKLLSADLPLKKN